MSKAEFEALARFRYQLRRFLRFSEEAAHRKGVTPLQYQLMLQIKGFPGREWATVAELAERLQAKHRGAVALISRCEKAGLVVRKLSRSDLRLVEVQLTAKSEHRLEQLARLHCAEHLSLRGEFSIPVRKAGRPEPTQHSDSGVLPSCKQLEKEIGMQAAHAFENADINLFRDIVEQAPDAIIFADCEGLIRVWNRGAEAVFGHAAADVLGKNLDVIIPEHLRRAHWEGFRRAIDSGQTKHGARVMTTRSMHKDGSKLYLDLSFSLIKNKAGAIAGALAVGRDCTERHIERAAQPARAE